MKRALRAASAAAYSLVGGIGGGLALLGEWKRAFAWLATALAMAGAGALLSPWLYVAVAIPYLGAAVHGGLRAARTTTPMQMSGPWPAAIFLSTVGFLVVMSTFVRGYRVHGWRMLPTLDHHQWVALDLSYRSFSRGDLVAYESPCHTSFDAVERVLAVGGDTIEIRCGVVYVNGHALSREPIAGECVVDTYEGYGDHAAHRFACRRYREAASYEIIEYASLPAPEFPTSTKTPKCQYATSEFELTGAIVGDEHDPADRCAPHLRYIVPDDYVFLGVDDRSSTDDSRAWGAIPADHIVGRVFWKL